ncbi:SDR family oxidoreductase, partial [Mammaliicoccus sciuri]|uniref:SDR family oxidoreductase n=1 Tax=Mammaliicoccus sciuri TaxID=1296 RepID=UPI000B2F3A1E
VSKEITLYSATKSAALMIFNGLEKELARTGIKTTSIHPGMVATPMTENTDFGGRKKLDPENIADAVLPKFEEQGFRTSCELSFSFSDRSI